MVHEIEHYFGTYIGISPTDGSKVAFGEIEVTLGQPGLKIRHATGFTISEQNFPLEEVRQLREDEVRLQYRDGSDAYTRVDGFQIGSGAVLLFLREITITDEADEFDPRLIVRLGEFVEALGLTVLFDEDQVAEGALSRIIEHFTEQVGEYPLPRLEYGGRHEPSSN